MAALLIFMLNGVLIQECSVIHLRSNIIVWTIVNVFLMICGSCGRDPARVFTMFLNSVNKVGVEYGIILTGEVNDIRAATPRNS